MSEKGSKIAHAIVTEQIKIMLEDIMTTFEFVQLTSIGTSNWTIDNGRCNTFNISTIESDGMDSEYNMIRNWTGDDLSLKDIEKALNF